MSLAQYPSDKFPRGHPEIATNLANRGVVYELMGDYQQAAVHLEQALAMRQKLYPESAYPRGHPDRMLAHLNLGWLHLAQRGHERALTHFEQSLTQYRRQNEPVLKAASEAEALALLRIGPDILNGYLTAALTRPDTVAASYAQVWAEKAAVMRVLQRRHESARVARAKSPELEQKWNTLRDKRQVISKLLTQPSRDLAARDARLRTLTDEAEKLERELASVVPELVRSNRLEALGPQDLAKALPPRSAFIDILRYRSFENRQTYTEAYLAFILFPNGTIERVQLKDAQAIDRALAVWRRR
jgi:tetratricopeptide (TPR) repeat protein